MKTILMKFGYNGEVFNYVTKKTCGIWFSFIGIIIILAAIFGNGMYINPFIFVIGYSGGYYLCYGNRKIIFDKLATGKQTDFQKKTSDFALFTLCFLCAFFGTICWLTKQNIRTIWLCLLLATAIHFFVFYFVHGRSVVVLGILCLMYCISGLLFPSIPFLYIALLDGITKIAVGIFMFFQKQGNNEQSFYRKVFL